MEEQIKALRDVVSFLVHQEIEIAKKNLEQELEIIRLNRGIETIAEVLKTKEGAYKDIIDALKNALNRKPQEQQKEQQKKGGN